MSYYPLRSPVCHSKVSHRRGTTVSNKSQTVRPETSGPISMNRRYNAYKTLLKILWIVKRHVEKEKRHAIKFLTVDITVGCQKL